MKKLITTKKLMTAAEMSREGLRLWVKREWLPEPILQSYGPGKRGRTGWWNLNVITQILFIKTLKQIGKSVQEISEILGVKND